MNVKQINRWRSWPCHTSRQENEFRRIAPPDNAVGASTVTDRSHQRARGRSRVDLAHPWRRRARGHRLRPRRPDGRGRAAAAPRGDEGGSATSPGSPGGTRAGAPGPPPCRGRPPGPPEAPACRDRGVPAATPRARPLPLAVGPRRLRPDRSRARRVGARSAPGASGARDWPDPRSSSDRAPVGRPPDSCPPPSGEPTDPGPRPD